jgi:hypothetical protein
MKTGIMIEVQQLKIFLKSEDLLMIQKMKMIFIQVKEKLLNTLITKDLKLRVMKKMTLSTSKMEVRLLMLTERTLMNRIEIFIHYV